jgi:hypothetical protein
VPASRFRLSPALAEDVDASETATKDVPGVDIEDDPEGCGGNNGWSEVRPSVSSPTDGTYGFLPSNAIRTSSYREPIISAITDSSPILAKNDLASF